MVIIIIIKDIKQLKGFNKKITNHKQIRTGTVVNTKRGFGIVTYRNKDKLVVANRPTRELEWCDKFCYKIDDVQLSDQDIDSNSKLFRSAWNRILSEALQNNIDYELEKHKWIFENMVDKLKCKTSDRRISLGVWGSETYRRYTGINKREQPFYFELSIKNPFIPYGDRILYALAEDDGYITDMNGYGRIYRRKIEDKDINYGLCKYAGKEVKE